MLSEQKVLFYVKDTLGYPHVNIEKSDESIMTYIKMFTIPEFSKYIPNKAIMKLDTSLPEVKTNMEDIFYVQDPDGCDVLTVEAVIQSESSLLMHSYPYVSPFTSYESLPDMVLTINEAETAAMFSRSEIAITFYPPNKLRIANSESMGGEEYLLRYERSHKETFETIPVEFQPEFLTMCLADTMINCGNIRNKYGSIATPFGEIPINAELGNQGRELKTAVLDKLKEQPPNTLIYVG